MQLDFSKNNGWEKLEKINNIYNDITLNNNVEQYYLFYMKSHRSLQLMLEGHF